MAEGFFADVNDMKVMCNEVRVAGDHVAYFWTFTGRHAGTGRPLHVVGWEDGISTAKAGCRPLAAGMMPRIMPGRWTGPDSARRGTARGRARRPMPHETFRPPTQTAFVARSSPIMIVGNIAPQMSEAPTARWAMAGVEARSITTMSASIPGARLPIW